MGSAVGVIVASPCFSAHAPAQAPELPALDIVAGTSFACDRKWLSSYRHVPADAPFIFCPYLGPPLHTLSRADATARLPVPACRSAPGRRAVSHACRAASGPSLVLVAGSGRNRQGRASRDAVDRPSLGAGPASALCVDCGTRRCPGAAKSMGAFVETCRSTLALRVGKPRSGAGRIRRGAHLGRRAAKAGPLVSRTLSARQ